jgi:type IV secretion system protein VirD4
MPKKKSSLPNFLSERRVGNPLSGVAIAALAAGNIFLAVWATTQFFAHRLGYHQNLGEPAFETAVVPVQAGIPAAVVLVVFAAVLFRFGNRRLSPLVFLGAGVVFGLSLGPLFSPFDIIKWWQAYQPFPEMKPELEIALQFGFVVLIMTFPASMFAASSFGTKRVSNAHGTATWSSGDELLEGSRKVEEAIKEAVDEDEVSEIDQGLLIGRHDNRSLLRYFGDSHLITMAPTRSGKGIGSVIPNLLYYTGGVVVTDVKGENFQVTYRRRLALKQRVIALDPFRVTGEEHSYHGSFNPLDMVDVSGPRKAYARDDAQLIASMLIQDGGKENSHWTEEGKALIAGLILYVCVEHYVSETPKTLLEMRRLLTLPGDQFTEILDWMLKSKDVLVQRCAARLLQKDDKERSGVISTAQAQTGFLDSPMMANVLKDSNFDMSQIKGSKPLSIFLVIPPAYLDTHAAWLRIMITCCLEGLTRTQGKPKRSILFLLDEFANLGQILPVVKGISLVGGYGAKFWLYIQDLSQLKGVYKDNWSTIFANTDVKQLFGTNDYETAKLLSDMTGEATIYTESGSDTMGKSMGKSSGSSTSHAESISEKGRKLLLPDEVMRMDRDKQLLLVKGSNPMVLDKLYYYADKEFKDMYDDNPMHAS